MTEEYILKAIDIHKNFQLGKVPVNVLQGVNLEVSQGEWIALLGASGSGKTTLLNIIGTLERPDSGQLFYKDTNYSSFSKRQNTVFRGTKIGFIFQAYHMLPELNVFENVFLPGMLNKNFGHTLKEKARDLLNSVGLSERLNHRPNELSGGEQQRAAIARAMINSPEIILADEPTGNLDSKTGQGILEVFQELHKSETAKTIIMVTHDRNVAKFADRIIELRDGVICNNIEQ